MSDVARPSSGSGRSGWRDALVSASIIVIVVGMAMGARAHQALAARPTADQCDALLDRFVDLASRARLHDVSPRAVAARQRELLGQPLRLAERRRCEQALTSSQVRCALEAPNVDELERCVQ